MWALYLINSNPRYFQLRIIAYSSDNNLVAPSKGEFLHFVKDSNYPFVLQGYLIGQGFRAQPHPVHRTVLDVSPITNFVEPYEILREKLHLFYRIYTGTLDLTFASFPETPDEILNYTLKKGDLWVGPDFKNGKFVGWKTVRQILELIFDYLLYKQPKTLIFYQNEKQDESSAHKFNHLTKFVGGIFYVSRGKVLLETELEKPFREDQTFTNYRFQHLLFQKIN